MGLLALFRRQPKSANIAKERLRIIVAQERTARGGPGLPAVATARIARSHSQIRQRRSGCDRREVEKEDGHEVLELSVALPEKKAARPNRERLCASRLWTVPEGALASHRGATWKSVSCPSTAISGRGRVAAQTCATAAICVDPDAAALGASELRELRWILCVPGGLFRAEALRVARDTCPLRPEGSRGVE